MYVWNYKTGPRSSIHTCVLVVCLQFYLYSSSLRTSILEMFLNLEISQKLPLRQVEVEQYCNVLLYSPPSAHGTSCWPHLGKNELLELFVHFERDPAGFGAYQVVLMVFKSPIQIWFIRASIFVLKVPLVLHRRSTLKWNWATFLARTDILWSLLSCT